ncbi:MAG: lipopolysaccharide biosynthesis protein [Pedobacter sp.]|nr:lipopolysaccharide biosynthesis protein [Pedobacter sp.]MDQ8052889.1 lipopolysaccharide biosynthesis protein [Pedobacter sp.]
MVQQADTIKDKSLKSIKWVSLGVVLPKLISPLTTIILANMLLPKDFGIISICTAFISFFNLIQGLGFTDYIIKEKEIEQQTLYDAFWGNLGISIIFYLILVLLSPILAHIYSSPVLLKVFPVLSLTLLINAIGLVPNSLLKKSLKFKALFFIQFVPMFVNIMLVVPFAYFGYGIWSLVIGSLVQALLVNVLYIFTLKWKPRFYFNRTGFIKMFKFGKFVVVEQLMEFLYGNLDVLLIGYFLDLTVAGSYFLAKNWIQVIFNAINGSISNIIYPSLHHYKEDPNQIRIIFENIEKRMIFLNLPIIVGTVLLAPIAVTLFLPNKWENVSLIIGIIVIGEGTIRNLSLQRDIFKIIDRPEIYPKAFIINLFFAVVSFPIAAKFGILAFCITRMLNDFLYTFIQMKLVKKYIGFSFYSFFRISKYTLLSCLIMGIVLFFGIHIFKLYLQAINYYLFAILVIFGMVSYGVSYMLLDRLMFNELVGNLKVIVGLKKK